MIRCRRLRRLSSDTEGSVLLEAMIVVPAVVLFVMLVMELSLIFNAKQLANYAAFCAARTAAVYGLDSTGRAKTHLAAAMAMSSISAHTPQNAEQILLDFGVANPDSAVQTLCNIPGFEGQNAAWLARLANAFVRTGAPTCDTGTAPGKTRKHVAVGVTYIYRCSILPFGDVWGNSGLNAYLDALELLTFHDDFQDAINLLRNSWRWNIPIRGRAVTDYWAG
jgi:hypothetical protein